MSWILLVGVWLAVAVSAVACGVTNAGSGPAGTMRAFMQAAEARDVDRAYAAFSAADVPRSEVERLVADPVLFEQFQDLKVDRWAVLAPPDSNRGKLTGTVVYATGHTGRFEAEMVQAKEGWRLTRVNISVGANRLREYQQSATPSVPAR